jgi:DNA processing protein
VRGVALTDAERINWLRLARTEAVGPVTFAHLIAQFGSAGRALEALPDLARRGGRDGTPKIFGGAEAEAELAAGSRLGARMIGSGEPDFPRLLSALDAPPPLLWALGDAGLMARRTVSIVGTRECSAAGQRIARALAGALGEAGYIVVSGMARGIDAAAHWGAIDSGTIAVLAGGVDNVWPPQNASLYERIGQSGCIVSSRPPGFEPRAKDFPRRNAIISGLSLGVVIVEAEMRSGSLITARLAADQGREVFAVPGSPLDPRSRGTNDLIRQGATLVEDADDVLRVLNAQPGVGAPDVPTFEPAELDEEGLAGLSGVIASLLSTAPTSFDDLARLSGAPTSAVLACLTELAVAGRAELLPGGLAVAAG